jgi:glycosyltransferase involved in cell wall biosynthesis
MELGIFTPYRRSEITAAALRLADLALTVPFDVKILASGAIERGIHPYWDTRVVTTRKQNVYKWARGCSHLVWFEYHLGHHDKTRVVTDKAKQWYVACWHHIQREEYQQTWLYDRIIAPSPHAYAQVTSLICEDDPSIASWCMWDSGLDPVERLPAPHVRGRVRLYVPIDGDAIDLSGMVVLQTLWLLLDNHPNLDVTLDSGKSWPKELKTIIKELKERYGTRFNPVQQTSLIWQPSYLHEHDWTWVPSLRANFGQAAWRALSCGTPVITYDIAPFSEFVQDGRNGKLLSCDLIENWLGAPAAVASSTKQAMEIGEIIADEELFLKCRKQRWKLKEHRAAFEKFWKEEWQVES